jgi:hypothetical protein
VTDASLNVEPLAWPRNAEVLSATWEIVAPWAFAAAAGAFLVLGLSSTLWWAAASPVLMLSGLWVGWAIRSRRLRAAYERIEEDLAKRGELFDTLWCGDPARREAAREVVGRVTWRNKALGPDDPFAIVVHDCSTGDTHEVVMFLAKDMLGQEISYECAEQLLEMTFGDAVDCLLCKRRAT